MVHEFLNQLPNNLQSKIQNIAKALPNVLDVFEEVYNFGQEQGDKGQKRRKVAANDSIEEQNVIFALNNISVLSPVRKKLNFILHLSNVDHKPKLSLVRNGVVELSIGNLRESIRMGTFLPVPEKPKLLYLFVQLSKRDGQDQDPILLTLNKESVLSEFKSMGLIGQEVTDFNKCIEYIRKQAILTGFKISNPFNTSLDIPVPAFHVECHRGTKEGTLYFLPEYVIFGFKKPILVFESSNIESISYSSITRLTFNVTLITKEDEGYGNKFEFSMIDQTEYAKIDEYVKAKQVRDESMSEELKAKTINKNKEKSAGSNQPSALQEAAKQMQDEANINGVPFDSEDDEEADGNFEVEGDLSDGSDVDEEEEEDEDEEGNEEEAEEVDEEVEEEKIEPESNTLIKNITANTGQTPATNVNAGLFDFPIETPSFDIPIELEDDDEGSGVEYD
ncbi:Uncharacterized protein RNJ44_04319 [Nakaseomyces bracarensis]|uniref:Histone chaperone RTT106 n=1 Tax=Nakaseomyces bracarensis TaxID=273131 RepID=A0ABR4NUP7_9SACH